MLSLREYCQADAHVSYHLWVLVFPIVWAALEKQQQVTLAKPIIALLSKEYHHKQAHHRPNIIQVRAQARQPRVAAVSLFGVDQPACLPSCWMARFAWSVGMSAVAC